MEVLLIIALYIVSFWFLNYRGLMTKFRVVVTLGFPVISSLAIIIGGARGNSRF